MNEHTAHKPPVIPHCISRFAVLKADQHIVCCEREHRYRVIVNGLVNISDTTGITNHKMSFKQLRHTSGACGYIKGVV